MATCLFTILPVANRALQLHRSLNLARALGICLHVYLLISLNLHALSLWSESFKAQVTAASAVQWCVKSGGSVDNKDVVKKISNVATQGKYPGNAERDFHTLIKSFNKRLGATIETVQVRMFNHKTACIEYQPLEVIFPDTMAGALYRMSPRVWRKCMYGDLSPGDVAFFWQHCEEHCDFFKSHPCRNYPNKSGLIPFSLYGDDIAVYKNAEISGVSVVGWTSDLAWGNSAFLRYFPICVYAENNACDFTYQDLMSHVVPRLQSMFDPEILHEWSGEGHHFMMSSIQGDLKWINMMYSLHNYRKNACCSLCGCCKDHENISMTIGEFSDSAAHIGTSPDLTEFLANRSIVFDLPGASIGRVMHDVCHGQMLGTGRLVNGSALILLCEDGFFGDFRRQGVYKDIIEDLLREAHKQFLMWKKTHRLQCSQPRFTASRLSRRHRNEYPVLQSKAIPSKVITYWLTECLLEHAAKENATEYVQMAALCMDRYAKTLRLMETHSIVFDEDTAVSFCDNAMEHLRSYAILNGWGRDLRRKVPGRNLWLLAPKHHHFWHMARQVRVERINPAYCTLLCAEDFVGKLGKISRATHRLTVSLRTLQRYLTLM